MGIDLVEYICKKITKQQKLAFTSSFFATLFIHLYFLTNTLPNHDSVLNYYSTQNVLASGRWALSTACGFTSYFDLPWINGIMSSIFIGLTVTVIVTLFRIKNPILIILTGCLFAASPATTDTFFFIYTADGYMIAMFLAAMAVYWSRMGEKRKIYWILSAVCICVCCGIYQAYVSFGLILAVCYFMLELLWNQRSKKDCLQWVLRQIWVYGLGLLCYYFVWKTIMCVTDTVASDYQGIAEIESMTIALMGTALIDAVKSFVLYFISWDITNYGLTPYIILNLCFGALFIVGLLISVKESGILKRLWALSLFALCLISIIPFACMWHFASPGVAYGPRMLQSLTILYVFCGVLFEVWSGKILKNLVGLLLLLTALNNAIVANISYFYLNLCYERTYAEGVEMMMEIHDVPNYRNAKRIAIIGSRYYDVTYDAMDSDTAEHTHIRQIQSLSATMDKTLLFDADHTAPFLKWVFGLEMEQIKQDELKQIKQIDAVQKMPCWPNEGSICVFDDILVIKLAGE